MSRLAELVDPLAELADVVVTVLQTAEEHDVRYPAAALAYYVFVSILPFLVLVIAVLGESFAAGVQGATPRFLTPEAERLVYESLSAARGRTGAALFAFAVFVWSGTNVVVAVQSVVDRVERPVRGPTSRERLDAVGVLRTTSAGVVDAVAILGSLGLAIVAVVLTSAVFASLPTAIAPLPAAITIVPAAVALVGALAVAFLPLYYVPSRVVTSARAALPGALVAAGGWTILLAVVQVYAANATQYAMYGVLTGVILILTSLYLAAVVLLVGVVVNATLAEAGGDRNSTE